MRIQIGFLISLFLAHDALACGGNCEVLCSNLECGDGYKYSYTDFVCHAESYSDALGSYCDDGYICTWGPCGRANERACNTALPTHCSACADHYKYSWERGTCVLADVGADSGYDSWMTRYAPFIQFTKLSDLIIPGTHDSGSFDMAPLSKCQEQDFNQQLNGGIRHFDIRVGMSFGELRIPHGSDYNGAVGLYEALVDFQQFAAGHPREVIILTTSHFAGEGGGSFTPSNYQSFYDLVTYYLGDYLVPSGISPASRMIDIWNTGKNVIVNVDVDPNDASWSAIGHSRVWTQMESGLYANTTDRDRMRLGLTGEMFKYNDGNLFVLHTEATPDTSSPYTRAITWSPSELADTVNPVTQRWIAQEFLPSGRLNIIQGDFFNRGCLVDIAVYWNWAHTPPPGGCYPWPPLTLNLTMPDGRRASSPQALEWDSRIWDF